MPDLSVFPALELIKNPFVAEFPGEEEPDASAPLQNSEDITEDDISSR